jgi:hypothetical protein
MFGSNLVEAVEKEREAPFLQPACGGIASGAVVACDLRLQPARERGTVLP